MFGIDKIQLTGSLEGVEVKEATERVFGFNRNTRQGHGELPYLLTDRQGKQVFANGIHHNGKYGQYSINQKGLLVQFNPSKATGHPYHLSATGRDFFTTVRGIKQDLQEAGIVADINRMKLCRLDLAKQAEMSNPFGTYIDAFRMLKGKRAKQQRLYPNGYYVGNDSWQTIGYDKGQQLSELKVLIDEKNFMRLENKFMDGRLITAQVGVTTLPELADCSPDELHAVYVKHLNTKFFPRQFDGEQSVLDFGTVVDAMKTTKEKYSKGWFLRFISIQQVDSFIVQLGGMEGVRKALLEVVSKQRASDHIKELTELLYFKSQLDSQANSLTVASLLYEIQERFAA